MKDVVKSGVKDASGSESIRRSKREQGSIVGYCAIAFVFVSLIFLVLCLTVFFKVKMVEINGLTLYREEQILGVGGIINDENLIRTDTKLIKQRLEENLVFIESAQVEKKYPSTLIVNITEAEKATDIIVDDKFCVASKTGRVLEMGNAAATGGIPVIRGFELSSKKPGDKLESKDTSKLKIYNDMIKILDNIGMKNITEIDLSSRSGITILYDGRITLELGSSVDLDYKLSYFKSVIDSKLSEDFRGRLVYNGADSGISAIPEGAGVKDDEPKDDSSSKPDDENKQGENGENGGDTANTDPNANAANTDPNNYGYMQNTDPNGNTNYGYMQNTDPNGNTNYGYMQNTDPNGNTNYGYMQNTDPNGYGANNYNYDYGNNNYNYNYNYGYGTPQNYDYNNYNNGGNAYGANTYGY